MYLLRCYYFACIIFASVATRSFADDSLSAEAVQRLKEATVYVKTEIGPVKFAGSGFVISVTGDSALIVTNQHVVSKPKELKQGSYLPGLRGRDRIAIRRLQQSLATSEPVVSIVFNSGNPDEQLIKAELLGGFEEPDLAILKVSGIKSPPKPISFQQTSVPFETMPLYILGFPFGEVLATNNGNPTITIGKGSISSIRKDQNGKLAKLQIDGALNPGNSGGPVVDSKGSLVGIAVQTIQGSNIGLAIPPGELSSLLEGRVGSPTIIVGKPEKGTIPKYEVNVPVIDPMKKLKSVWLHYVDGAASIDSSKSGQLQLTSTDSRKLDLSINGANATASLPLVATSDQQAREVTVQAVIVNSAGQTIHQDPIVVKVAAPQLATTTIVNGGDSTTFTQTTQNPGGGTSRRQVTVSRGGAGGASGGTASGGLKSSKKDDDDEAEMDAEEAPSKTTKKTGTSKSALKSKSKSSEETDESEEKIPKKVASAVWVNKISKMKTISDDEVSGKIDGLDFTLGKATLNNIGLKLEMGKNDSDEGVAHIQFFLFAGANNDVSGQKCVVNGRVRSGDPHIHLSSQRKTDRSPRTQSHLEYLMVLEFGEYNAEDRVQPGKIYVCFPDRGKSFIAGSFEARAD